MSSKPSFSSDGSAHQNRQRLLDRLRASGAFGFGASSLGNLYAPMSDEQARRAVDSAWDAGIRYFDTAPFYGYGLSERRLGAALSSKPRDEFLLSTKVGRLLVEDPTSGTGDGFQSALPFRPVFDYSFDGVLRSVDDSLSRLGLDRIDILLMHDIGAATHGEHHDRHWRDAVDGGFRALERLRTERVVSAIGLGVNEVGACVGSLDHVDFDLFLLAGRYTLLDQSAGDFFDLCRARNIGVIAAGVFNSGILATGAGRGGAYFDYGAAPDDIADRVQRIEMICSAFGISLAAAAHRFVETHPAVTQTLLGLRDEDQLKSALDNQQQAIPPALWQALEEAGLIRAVAQATPEANV